MSQLFEADSSLKPVLPPARQKSQQNQVTLTPQQENQMREIFELFDSDGGGTIDRQELKIAMRAMGFQGSDSAREQHSTSDIMLDAIDTDGSDGVSLAEFTALMKGELLLADPLEEIRAIFAARSNLDEGRDPGRITLEKLRLAGQRFQIRLTEDELAVMMSEVDEDGCGGADEAEFIHVMGFSPWF